MKILFVNLSALKFTASTPDHAPLGGSESALCYLARALERRGHDISITANLPDGASNTVENIRHFPLATIRDVAFFATEKFTHIIICNAPAASAPLKTASPHSRIVFWAHALPDQPAMQALAQAEVKNAINEVIFVSEWQRTEIENSFGVFAPAHIIGNGIAPVFENMFASPQELLSAKQNRAAYTTTPYRGLSVLLRAMEGFVRPTKLDLFSSMKVYQGVDDEFVPLFNVAAQNPAITLHGSVTQSKLAQSLRSTAFLFYPSIYRETFCITALEAMAAGMAVISTHLGALPETTMGFADLVPLTSNDGEKLAQDFRSAMHSAVDKFTTNPEAWAQDRFAQMQQINKTATWAVRALAWEVILMRALQG